MPCQRKVKSYDGWLSCVIPPLVLCKGFSTNGASGAQTQAKWQPKIRRSKQSTEEEILRVGSQNNHTEASKDGTFPPLCATTSPEALCDTNLTLVHVEQSDVASTKFEACRRCSRWIC